MESDRFADAGHEAELRELVAQVLAAARRRGASAAEAAVHAGRGLSVTVRLGELETVEHTRDRSLGVTVYFGQRSGSASSNDFSAPAVAATVEAACAIARHTAEDPCSGLADPERLAREIPDLDLYHPWGLAPREAAERALACEQAARDHDPRIVNSEGASLASFESLDVYGNSHGFLGARRATRHSLSCSVVGRDAQGMQRDHWYTVARAAEDLEAPEAVGRRAAQRAVARLGARRIRSCRVPVLYEAPAAVSLLGHFVGAVRGQALYRRASFLADKLGEPVFAPQVQIYERPRLSRAMGSAAFDHEGVATADRDLVRDGVLEGYVLDSYSACKLGMATTANAGGVHNLTLDPGEDAPEALLRRMGRGLWVTELIGFGVNTVTGDYSRGAAGFWVEDGAVQYPVEEITVAGNLLDMFRNIVAAGHDLDTRRSLRCPSLLLEGMTVAGQ